MLKAFGIAYIASLLTFLLIDAIWLGVLAKQFYADQLGELMRKDVLFVPAGLFYLGFTAGIVLFAVRPNEPSLSLWWVAFYGAFIGFLAYGTYNFTNIATIRDWPISMSAVDLVWGMCLSAIVAVAGALAVRAFAS